MFISLNRDFLFGLGFFLTTMLIYSFMDAWAKYLLQDIHMTQITWVRYSVHAALLGFVLVAKGQLKAAFRPIHPWLQVFRSLCLLGVTVNMYFALKQISLASVSALVAVAPFIVAIGGRVLLGERVRMSGWIAIFAGFVGTMLIIRPGAGIPNWASLFALLAAFCFAGQQLVSPLLGC